MKQATHSSWFREQRTKLLSAGVLVIGLVAFPPTCKALFGLGDIVFDPSAYATLGEIWSKDISMEAKMIEEVQQAIKIYQNGKDIYDLATFMSHHLTDKRFMETVAADAGQLYIQGRSGSSIDAARIMNGDWRYGAEAGSGVWEKISSPGGDPADLSQEQPGQSVRLAQAATVGLGDAASLRCMQTLGQYSNYDAANRVAAVALKALHLDGSKDTNSQLTQQNINNGFAHQQLTELQTANAMRACEVSMQVAMNKDRLDTMKNQMKFDSDLAAARRTNPDSLDSEETLAEMKGGAVRVLTVNQ